jgi:putative exporter of polyketide antibiotics
LRGMEMQMRVTLSWVALVVAGVALLIAAVGAILALLVGHARFIEVAWVSIAASLFVLAWAGLERRE